MHFLKLPPKTEKNPLQHGMLRISLSVSLYQKTWWYPSPFRIFLPNSGQKILASLRDSSVKHFSEARLGVLANQLVGISSMVGWGVRRMMLMMMEPPFFVWRKTSMCPPIKKKHTHACFWLSAGVKKNNCVYAQSCTPAWRTRGVSWGVLMFFFWRHHAWNHRLSCIWRSCWDTPQQKNKQMYIQKSKLDRKMSMSL